LLPALQSGGSAGPAHDPALRCSILNIAKHIQIYDLATLELLRLHEAHNGVLLSLDFAPRPAGNGSFLLASGGRDGLIHLYDAGVSRWAK
jgi:WD40 repeat protein